MVAGQDVRRVGWLVAALFLGSAPMVGCKPMGVVASVRTDNQFDGHVHAAVDLHNPSVTDPGPVVPAVGRAGRCGEGGPRCAVIDVDGLMINQNLTGAYSLGENPVSSFREKLELAAADPAVRGVVLRVNTPGGGVTAADIMAEELRRFRSGTGKPVVACLMDLGTSGGYYLAVGCDTIYAHPTAITGGIGALFNAWNLEDALSQMGVRVIPMKSRDEADMGTYLKRLEGENKRLIQEMVNGFRDRFMARVVQSRPGMTAANRAAIEEGRVVPAPEALRLHLVDALGYIDDAIADVERRAGVPGSEVILYHRSGYPARSLYAISPNIPGQSDILPLSLPGIDRSKLPTFLYLWQVDPTYTKQGGR